MKLEPRAKRVKIRITSGGEEHNNLDSLRKNFVCKDVLSLLDGRLVKWLVSIGESDKAEKIGSLEDSSENEVFEVYNILFSPLKEIHTFDDAIKASSSDGDVNRLVRDYIRQFDVARFLSYGDKANIFKEYPNIVLPLFEDFAGGNISASESSVVYNVGLILIEKGKEELGKVCVLEAAKKGYQDAVDYKKMHYVVTPPKNETSANNRKQSTSIGASSSIDIRALLKDRAVQKEINNILDFGYRNKKFPLEYEPIFQFVEACRNIQDVARHQVRYSEPPEVVYNVVKRYFGKIDESDPLFFEKKFVWAVTASKKSKEAFKMLFEKGYEPAGEMLKCGSWHCGVNSRLLVKFRSETPLYNARNLESFVMDLDKYVK
jgi:hypothetical protein